MPQRHTSSPSGSLRPQSNSPLIHVLFISLRCASSGGLRVGDCGAIARQGLASPAADATKKTAHVLQKDRQKFKNQGNFCSLHAQRIAELEVVAFPSVRKVSATASSKKAPSHAHALHARPRLGLGLDGSGSNMSGGEEDVAASTLGPYLGRLPQHVLRGEVLPKLGATSLGLFARVNGACEAAVVAAAGMSSVEAWRAKEKLKVEDFVGSVEMLKFARTNGCPWDRRICKLAAQGGHLEVLQWARANGCPWDWETCAWAAAGGHLDVLRWARENGCEWDALTCAYAAGGGHLEVLRWARDNGCEWDEETCAYAAGGGHLEVLQWARENGCEWNSETCELAAANGQLEVLRWARENGCE